MIDAAAFDRMKETAVLINTARGRVVDHDALVEALTTGTIDGAVIDVYPSEPPEPTDRIFDCETASVTPHLAGATVETRTEMLETTAKNMLQILNGEDVDHQYIANPDVLDSKPRSG